MSNPWVAFAISLASCLAVALAVIVLVALLIRLFARRWPYSSRLAHSARAPFRVLVLIVALWSSVGIALPEVTWRPVADHVLQVAVIVAATWLLCGIALFLIDLGLRRYRIDVPDNRTARRLRTQVLLMRRLTVVIAVVLGGGAVLLTFDGIEAVGASVLASAGLVSIVAGLAAQSTLANVFAGIQLAFNGAIRIDDVVIVEGEWGRIEEITLTYVVVHVWDDRRLVLPSTYFVNTPFQNWTRHTSELLGAVEFDLDWRVRPGEMREELDRILADTPLWDGRVRVLQVTDATGGVVRVRILLTAADAPTLFDLRCFVRERMVTWLQAVGAPPVPRSRVELVESPKQRSRRREDATGSNLFSGGDSGEQRGSLFTGPIETIERRERPERAPHVG